MDGGAGSARPVFQTVAKPNLKTQLCGKCRIVGYCSPVRPPALYRVLIADEVARVLILTLVSWSADLCTNLAITLVQGCQYLPSILQSADLFS